MTGFWSKSGARLGNALCMTALVLLEAERLGGSVEMESPGSRYFNTNRLCVEPRDVTQRYVAMVTPLRVVRLYTVFVITIASDASCGNTAS